MSSSPDSNLVEDLQQEIENTSNSLQDLLDQARSDDGDPGTVVKQLRENVQQSGQTVGQMIQTAFESTDSNDQDFVEELRQDVQETGTDLKQALQERTN
jgi:DNA-binding ferritin-like protein